MLPNKVLEISNITEQVCAVQNNKTQMRREDRGTLRIHLLRSGTSTHACTRPLFGPAPNLKYQQNIRAITTPCSVCSVRRPCAHEESRRKQSGHFLAAFYMSSLPAQ